MFGEVIPRTINDWFKKAIQFDTNWREATAIFGQNKKNDNRTMNRSWYKPAEKKDPNTMDMDALMFKERQTLMKQKKCFKCRKTGHRVLRTPFLLWHMLTMLFTSLFHIWSTCISLKADMPFTYVYHIFTLCFTCVCLKANTPLYLFKPAVRHLYSLAFHWES